MKKILFLLMALASIFMLGATKESAYVEPTKNFYVNDHADVLFTPQRDEISQISNKLYEETNIQAVLLTVNSLNGVEPYKYGYAIINDWQIGDIDGLGAILIFERKTKEIYIVVGNKLSNTYNPNIEEILTQSNSVGFFNNKKYSVGILNTYKLMINSIYESQNIKDYNMLTVQELPASMNFAMPSVMLIGSLLIFLRSIKTSIRYRKKYMHRYNPRRRISFLTERSEDHFTKHVRDYPETVERREGFIIHRDPINPNDEE